MLVKSLLVMVVLSGCLLSPVLAEEITWTNATTDEQYGNPYNWSTGMKPESGDDVRWLYAGGNVNFSNDENAGPVYVANTVTWSLNGYTYQTNGQYIGAYDIPGNLTTVGGSVLSGPVYIGHSGLPDGPTGTGQLTLDDTSWNAYLVGVGMQDTGVLHLTNGSSISSALGSIGGWSGTTGTAILDGESCWTVHDQYLRVGVSGSGNLQVSDGSLVHAYNEVLLAQYEGSSADVSVTGVGSWLVSSGITVGMEGQAVLNVQQGGNVDAGYVSVGLFAGGKGAVNVSGAGSQVYTGQQLVVGGEGGRGDVSITDGGVITSGQRIEMAQGNGSAANVSVQGAGSKLVSLNEGIQVGTNNGDAVGSAVLDISDGGLVYAQEGRVVIGDEDWWYEGFQPDNTARVTIDGYGSRLASKGNGSEGILITGNGPTTVQITNGGKLSAGLEMEPDMQWTESNLHIGGLQTRVTVEGQDSKIQAGGEISVGGEDVTLSVLDGGTVSSGHSEYGYPAGIYFGQQDTSATVIVDGEGSRIHSPGEMILGQDGDVDMVIGGGAEVSASFISIAERNNYEDSRANVSIDGGRLHSNSGIVTGEGSTTITITNGGEMSSVHEWGDDSGIFLQGGYQENQSYVRIEGAGSRMVSQEIYVGGNNYNSMGPITLELRNGGRMEAYENIRIWDQAVVSMDDSSLVAHQLENHGSIRGNGMIHADFVNNTDGTVLVTAQDFLEIAHREWEHHNYGQINMIGGTIQWTGLLNNEQGGVISGRGGLIFNDGMINHGQMNFGGDTDIYGPVVIGEEGELGTDGEVVVSGGASVAFYGDVVHNGVKFRVNTNANVVFFGLLSGAGGFEGGGGVFIEGGFNPGNSPEYLQYGANFSLQDGSTCTMELGGYIANGPGDTEYDVIEMIDGCSLSLDGDLSIELWNGFAPVLGSTFDIFRYDFGDCTGQFDGINQPTLPEGYYFDITYGDTAVTLTLMPEPASLSLLGMGALVLLRKRRK